MTAPSDGTADGIRPDDAPESSEAQASEAQAHFRRTLVRVMAMQIAALIALWWLQFRYTL
jgi:hypothetical protein